jgi:hypothetical protein
VGFALACDRFSVTFSGLFCICSFVIETGSVFAGRSGRPIEIGELNTVRLESQLPVSTTR